MAGQIRAWVLSKSGNSVRRETVAQSLEASLLKDWQFFDTLPMDAFDFTYDENLARAKIGKPLVEGLRNNLINHIRMIETFLDTQDIDIGLFLEDDIVIDPYFDFAAVPELMRTGGLGYLKLYGRAYVPSAMIARLGRFTLYRANWQAYGTQCYALDRPTAAALMKWIRGLPAIGEPWDNMLDDFTAHGVPAYLLYPFPVMELNYPSTVLSMLDEAPIALDGTKLAPVQTEAQVHAPPALGMRVRRWLASRQMKAVDAQVRARVIAQSPRLRQILNR